MIVRGMSARTGEACLVQVAGLAKFYRRCPAEITEQEIVSDVAFLKLYFVSLAMVAQPRSRMIASIRDPSPTRCIGRANTPPLHLVDRLLPLRSVRRSGLAAAPAAPGLASPPACDERSHLLLSLEERRVGPTRESGGFPVVATKDKRNLAKLLHSPQLLGQSAPTITAFEPSRREGTSHRFARTPD